jgi:hypothetical protein
MNTIKASMLCAMAFVLAGCTIIDLAKTPPTPMPEVGYWYQKGYSLEQTRHFISQTCQFTSDKSGVSIEQRRSFEQCMVRGGFAYMRDHFNLRNQGYAPLDKKRCAVGNPYADLPGCQSVQSE